MISTCFATFDRISYYSCPSSWNPEGPLVRPYYLTQSTVFTRNTFLSCMGILLYVINISHNMTFCLASQHRNWSQSGLDAKQQATLALIIRAPPWLGLGLSALLLFLLDFCEGPLSENGTKISNLRVEGTRLTWQCVALLVVCQRQKMGAWDTWSWSLKISRQTDQLRLHLTIPFVCASQSPKSWV